MELAQKEEIVKSWTSEITYTSNGEDVRSNHTLTVTNQRLIFEEKKMQTQKIGRTEVEESEYAREEVMLSSVKGFSCFKTDKQEKTLPKSSALRICIALLLGVLGIVSIFVFPNQTAGIVTGCVLLVLGFIMLLIPKGKEQVNCNGGYQLSVFIDSLKTLSVAGVSERVINLRISKSDFVEITECLGALIVGAQKKK